MTPEISDEQWQLIDKNIFRGTTIGAVKVIRDATGVGVHQAVDIADARRRLLKAHFPAQFASHPRLDDSESACEDGKHPIA